MKYNLLAWTAHSCRRDVFLEELERGNLPNYSSVIERGMFFPSAVIGGHFQRTSNLSEITGRPFNSAVHPRDNILNAAAQSGAYVGVVNDFIITQGGLVSGRPGPHRFDRPGLPAADRTAKPAQPGHSQDRIPARSFAGAVAVLVPRAGHAPPLLQLCPRISR